MQISTKLAYVSIFFLLVGGGLRLFLAFFTPSLQTTSPTVAFHLGDSYAQVQKVFGSAIVRQGHYVVYDLNTVGDAHYLLQFSKDGHIVSVERKLYPSEEESMTLTKDECMSLLAPGKFVRSYSSGYPGYPEALTYQSKTIGYGGNFFLSFQYANTVHTRTVQILSCQAAIGKVV